MAQCATAQAAETSGDEEEMIILDTDVLTLVQRDESEIALRIRARIAQLPPQELAGTTVITYHEQTRGWLAYLSKARTKAQQIYAYSLLMSHLNDYRTSSCSWL
jgi:tRNA(fMet)-specific endonuclease VapC